MFAGVDDFYRFSALTFVITALSLGVPLIICVILLILQHLRFRRFKQTTGQIYSKSSFPVEYDTIYNALNAVQYNRIQ